MSARHLITRQRFDFHFTSREEVEVIQGEIGRLHTALLVPALGALFDRLAAPGQLIRLGKIELDLGTISRSALASDVFARKVVQLLEQAIAEAIPPADGAGVQSLAAGHFDLWLHFLEHGSLPPYAAAPSDLVSWHASILEELAEPRSDSVARLRRLLASRPLALQRIILQHEAEFLERL